MTEPRRDDPHRETNGPAVFAFCVGVWLVIGVVYLLGRAVEWVRDA